MSDNSCNEDLFCGVNTPRNIEQMNDLEKKHTPVIDAPGSVKKGELFNVTIEVGKYLKHPNEVGHHIEFIELYSGDTFLVKVDLIPERTCPKIIIPISLTHSHPLRAIARCNLHGAWKSIHEITITND